jgi:hypothetical protein
MSIKNSSGTIMNRTRVRSNCSAVPQPPAPPRDHNNNAMIVSCVAGRNVWSSRLSRLWICCTFAWMNVWALKTKLLFVCSKSCVTAFLLTLNYPVWHCGTEIASVRTSLRSGIKVNGTNRLRKVVAWLQQIAVAAATKQCCERNMCESSALFVPSTVL